MAGLIRQTMFVPSATLTEKNVPDQTGRVHVVTGGYAGVGLELSKILYGANATVYIMGRSDEKGAKALETLKKQHPSSAGKVEFINCDLSDLKTIKPAAEQLLAREKRLDVLTNNAGVMMPPKGSKDAQGFELQLGTNCLGPFLLTKLLHPLLAATAKQAPPGSVRVTWAASSALDLLSPRTGGMTLDEASGGQPAVLSVGANYGQSKAGNMYLAREASRRDADAGIVHLAFNPGNLKSELQRHLPGPAAMLVRALCYDTIYGAYTELWAGVSPAITIEQSGSYVIPWGRLSGFRGDVEKAVKTKEEGGTGQAGLFWQWCDGVTAQFV